MNYQPFPKDIINCHISRVVMNYERMEGIVGVTWIEYRYWKHVSPQSGLLTYLYNLDIVNI